MSDGKKYYCFCSSNCKYETMTKEQILAAIQQAVTTGSVGDCDAGFITKVKELNGGRYVTFWVGTQEEYNALESHENNCMYIITDETTDTDIAKALEDAYAHANDTDNPHGVTAAQVGAVPAGYVENGEVIDGLVYYPYCTDESDLNRELTKEVAKMGKQTDKVILMSTAIVFGIGDYSTVRLSKGGDKYNKALAVFEVYEDDGVACAYKRFDGEQWEVLEWQNPPMKLDVEYRTTERWQKKPVYTKLISVGQLPAGAGDISKDYCELDYVRPIRCSGCLSDNTTLPQVNGEFEATAWVSHNTAYVTINSAPVSQYEAFVQVWYVKNV